MNQYQREAIAREISYVEDDLARCRLESQAAGNTRELNNRIMHDLEKLAELRAETPESKP